MLILQQIDKIIAMQPERQPRRRHLPGRSYPALLVVALHLGLPLQGQEGEHEQGCQILEVYLACFLLINLATLFKGEAAEGGGDGVLRGLRGERAVLQAGTQR